MQEYDVHDPASEDHEWKLHEWTGEESFFAARVLQHGNVGRAYREAFKPEKMSDQRCFMEGDEILERPWMRSYVAFVRKRIKKNMEVSRERILEELASLAFTNHADFVVIGEGGSMNTDLSGATREQMAAISEITVDTYMEGRGEDATRVKSVKIKLAPKAAAIELLGKYSGIFDTKGPEEGDTRRIDIVFHEAKTEPGDLE